MNQEKYIGMDVHAATVSAAVMNAEGKVLMECVLETKAATILEFIQGLRGTLALTFEEGTMATWLHDLHEASCQPAGGLRSAQERADEGWQPERSGGCTQLGGTTPHQPRPCGVSREAWNPCFKRVGAELLDSHQGQYPGDE